jgi:HK97 gp10 family phage protein
MAVRAKMTTKGFEEYLERLAKANQDIDGITDEALKAGGEILLDGMQRRVPKDTHNLEESLSLEGPERDGNFHYVEIGLSKKVDADTARYGTAQEYGTSNMAAQPYIRPALDEDMAKARRRMRDVFKKRGAL